MTDGVDLVRNVQELARDLANISQLSELYRRAVAGLIGPLGFDRGSLFLYNDATGEMRGTWGTDEQGRLVDESNYHTVPDREKDLVRKALENPDRIHYWDDIQLSRDGKAVGRGWNATVLLEDGNRVFGMLFTDNLIRHLPLRTLEREGLALYGRTLSALIQRRQFADLSEKYRAQNDLKDRLFTILAHDLRGPIGNLSVMLGFACDQPMDAGDLKEVLEESRQASQRTFNLLENVLGWVRGQIEEVAALRERIPITRCLVSVQIWLEASAKTKGIRLVVDCAPGLTVVTDERMLETIVRNLVSNAVKFSPRGAAITLRGRATDESIFVEVEDHGVGMPPEKVAALFLPEQKKSQSGTAGEGGSGLGLMFSSDLARTLGGRLEAESTLGQGSTFRLVLPDELGEL